MSIREDIKDGIEIAQYFGVPKRVIKIAIIVLLSAGVSGYSTYRMTSFYIKSKQDREDFYEFKRMLLEMQKEKLATSESLYKVEGAINNMSSVIEKSTTEELEIIDDLIAPQNPLQRVFNEKKKNIEATQQEKLPHKNDFKIGIKPKT